MSRHGAEVPGEVEAMGFGGMGGSMLAGVGVGGMRCTVGPVGVRVVVVEEQFAGLAVRLLM